jgi:hypothetical protein
LFEKSSPLSTLSQFQMTRPPAAVDVGTLTDTSEGMTEVGTHAGEESQDMGTQTDMSEGMTEVGTQAGEESQDMGVMLEDLGGFD